MQISIETGPVKVHSGDFPLVATRQVLVGRYDQIARNSFSVFLPDHVVKLAIGNKVLCSKTRQKDIEKDNAFRDAFLRLLTALCERGKFLKC